MAINNVQELFEQLLKSTTPEQVRQILTEIGDVSDIGLDKAFGKLNLSWQPYGGTTSNYSTIGLASKPGRSLTERITNAIDAVLEEHSVKIAQQESSPQDAVNKWFGRPFSTSNSGLYDWKYSQGNFDRKVGIVMSDSGKKEAPTVDVLDFGVGILPDSFPSTILSLQGGNKITRKYLVGAFGQGGASTLAFSEYVLVISRHFQNPNTVAFTLIKEITLGENYKENCYAYLCLKDLNQVITVPSFQLNDEIKLYDAEESLRGMKELKNGTLVRHYAFRLTNIYKALSPTEGNLYHYLHYSLFDPLIPFQIIDLRGKDPRYEIVTGSRNRLMKIASKAEATDSELDDSNTEYKLYKPFAFITPYGSTTPCIKIEYWVVFNYEKKKHKKTGVEYRDLRTDSNALYVQRKHPAVLTLNGQNQGELTVSQVSKDLGLDLVSKHLVIHIDATEAPINVKRMLFTTNREMLRDGDVLESIKKELREILKEDTDLAALEKMLEEKEISEVTDSTDDEVKKEIVKLLREAGFMPNAEGDSIRKGDGQDTDVPTPNTPNDPPIQPVPTPPLLTLPYPQVTKFEIVLPKEDLHVRLNKSGLIFVETDADSRFRNEVRIKIEPETLEISSYFPLDGGRIKWRVKASQNAKIGDKGKIIVSLTKPNGDQIKDEADFEIIEPIEKPAKEEKGFVPDFAVLPVSPGDDNWYKAWENVPEDSEEVFTVAYVPKKIGDKTIIYYSTVFPAFREMIDKLKISSSPLLKFFETNYKVWIGYHGILQYNGLQNEFFSDEEQEKQIHKERERDRTLVAQMQVKQALKSADLMYKFSKQNAAAV
ncbi:MAG: hypothetical protein H6549_09795 [Chitinophagales bacterium]|nr:hypothetical protein [Chitinophagales bacterium]